MPAVQTILINNRKLSQFEPLPEDIEFNLEKNYLFDLSHLAILSAEGEKAAEFLQGQYSCDVNEVNPEQIRQGLRCNLKGRIVGTADIVMHQGIKLLMPADLCESTINALMKTALFSKVSIKPSSHWKIYGFYLQNNEDLLPFPSLNKEEEKYRCIQLEEGCIYALGQGLYIIIVDKNADFPMLETFQQQQQWKSGLAWHKLCLGFEMIDIYEDSRGLFLPHRLDLHLKGFISFNKGCYKGQEIIARTHYKAKLKHRLQCFVIETDLALHSGQKLYDEDNQREVAELIDYCPLDAEHSLVALSILKDLEPHALMLEGQELQISHDFL